jgi:malate dehydrogenase (oxaloacetate-decarboxylating)
MEDGKDLGAGQMPFARKRSDVAGWDVSNSQEIGLLDVVRNAKPTVLIGVSSQHGAFTEEIVRTMAKNTERLIIFPLSNPNSQCEATLIGTGSPFGPAKFNGKSFHIDQTNNSYIFPCLALGIISCHARHVSDAMIKASARALAELSNAAGQAREPPAPTFEHSIHQSGGGKSRREASHPGGTRRTR